MSRVEAIMNRVNDRTESMIAAYREAGEGEIVGAIVPADEGNVMFVGLPLTGDECEEYIEALRGNMIKMALMGMPVELGVEALFRHAIMFGLLAHTVEEDA